ncbi:MAG: molybdopterin-binding protein [Pseudomonadota bacterium]
MKFGPVATEQADGALLAHALTVGNSRFKKGRVLTTEDVAAILAAGYPTVTVARLDPDDVVENLAAHRIARALLHDAKDTLFAAEPFTGRVNIYAKQAGLFKADAALVDQLNRIDPSITFATLSDDTFVETGRMVATVKIIPFAVARAALEVAQALCGFENLVVLHRVGISHVAHVSTELPTLKSSVMDKTRGTLQARLDLLGCTLDTEQRVPHTVEALASALRAVEPEADLIIIFGASAITDRADVLPAALEAAGGTVHQLGMPVDPGNLLLVGEHDGRPVIGAPGCARSPAENGFDWVLHRLACGVRVDPDYVTSLGVGGLLMEITSRPQPREATQASAAGDADDG